MTIRGATIYEVSHFDPHVGHPKVSGRQQLHHNESFEVEFDSAEFDDQHTQEGYRPEYDHDFMPKVNDIREITE